MGDILLTLLLLSVLALPGLTLWHAFASRRNTIENLATGLCFSFALGVNGLYFLALVSLKFSIVTWGILAGASALYWLQRRAELGGLLREGEDKKWLLIILALTAALRFLPTFFYELPRGWDPYSHLLLIQEIVLTNGHVYDWMPYEEIELRYPIGSHIFVAALSQASGMTPHTVFNLTLVWFGLLTCLQVFALVSEAQGSRELGFYAAAAYCLLPILGSWGYFAWGGLPNLQGVYFLLGAMTLFMRRDIQKGQMWALPIFFFATCLVNEHALGVAIVVFFALGIRCLIQREDRPNAKRLLVAGVVSMIAGLLYYKWRVPPIDVYGETGVLHYDEPAFTPKYALDSIGYAFSALAFAGVVIAWRRRKTMVIHPHMMLAGLLLLIAFIVLEYPGRLLTQKLFGKPVAFGSPSRILTDAVPLLAVFAAVSLWKLREVARWNRKKVLLLLLALTPLNYSVYASFFQRVISEERLATYAWIRANTPDDTAIIDSAPFAAYFSRRMTAATPLGSSENWAKAYNRGFLRQMELSIDEFQLPPFHFNYPTVMIIQANKAKEALVKMNNLQKGYLRPLWRSPGRTLYVFAVESPEDAPAAPK